MALRIDPDQCIDCAACMEPCPNTAIYPGGESHTHLGKEHPALSSHYYIVSDKCTECVTYYDTPQCVQECPVDCISKDPDRPEEKVKLEEKAKWLREHK